MELTQAKLKLLKQQIADKNLEIANLFESFKNATKLTEKTFLLMMKQIETLDLSFERKTSNWD